MRFIFLICGVIYANFAKADNSVSIGQFASELMEPVGILSDFISTGSIIVGCTCLFACFFRYMQYRVNPLASPISTVLVLLILGIALILLPFLYLLTGTGLPYPHNR